ncbi:MAG: SDR family NAD(P)-dependent oxidoreductase, partial [Candidatus Geothermarchaeales archaeon]
GATIEFENLRGESSSKGYRAYGQSKLANILFTYELAERLKGTGVSVNCLHPGTIRTRLGRDYGILGALWRWFPLLRSAKKGAETAIYLATSPEVQGASGKYFMDKKEARSSPESYDVTLRKQLWKISAELTGLGNDR